MGLKFKSVSQKQSVKNSVKRMSSKLSTFIFVAGCLISVSIQMVPPCYLSAANCDPNPCPSGTSCSETKVCRNFPGMLGGNRICGCVPPGFIPGYAGPGECEH